MKNGKQLEEDWNQTMSLKSLVQVYEEMAAVKMRQTRKRILQSREFLEALVGLSGKVRADLAPVFSGKGRREAAVLFSAKSGLFGDLVDRVTKRFLEFVDANKVDPVVVGAWGRRLVDEWRPGLRYEYLDIVDQSLDAKDLKNLSLKLSNYPKVTVFYAKFTNVVKQEAVSGDVTGTIVELVGRADKAQIDRLRYLYEPSVGTISEKFGREILTSVVEGMAEENQLSKHAARLLHLDQALDKIGRQLSRLDFMKRQVFKKNEEKRQQARTVRSLGQRIRNY